MLRPRYRPGWKPSWQAHPKKFSMEFEDWHSARRAFILDAVRISDGSLVMLKQIKTSWNPEEVEITQFLASDALRSDPRNHTVPVLDVLIVPDDSDITILVMPLLRACDNPRWNTLGEVIAFLIQVFEGIQYMHELHIAHRDCQAPNILYDPRPIYPKMFHPQVTDKARNWKGSAKHSTRTRHPVKYYIIDFGLSRRYNPDDGPPREHPIRGGDKSVPEFQNWQGELLDPFPTDIYYLGNMIVTRVLKKFKGTEFLIPLVNDMVKKSPSDRPTIQDVSRRFHDLVKFLGSAELRRRLVPRGEDPVDALFRDIAHTFRNARYLLARISPVPLPVQ
ncbi:kinase-like domain-containing protein [Trametes maxima]|nr:kinase-like domain-containing protein [Trametes maxima]